MDSLINKNLGKHEYVNINSRTDIGGGGISIDVSILIDELKSQHEQILKTLDTIMADLRHSLESHM